MQPAKCKNVRVPKAEPGVVLHPLTFQVDLCGVRVTIAEGILQEQAISQAVQPLNRKLQREACFLSCGALPLASVYFLPDYGQLSACNSPKLKAPRKQLKRSLSTVTFLSRGQRLNRIRDGLVLQKSCSISELNCDHFLSCSGCTLHKGLDKPPVLSRARQFFLQRGLQVLPVTFGHAHEWRLRARLAVRGKETNPIIGLFAQGTHEALNIPRCRQDDRAAACLVAYRFLTVSL